MALFDFIQNDRRIMDQRLRRHQLSQTEYLKYLKNLPDDKEQIEEVSVIQVDSERSLPPR